MLIENILANQKLLNNTEKNVEMQNKGLINIIINSDVILLTAFYHVYNPKLVNISPGYNLSY